MFEWQLAIKGEDTWGRRTVVAETAGKAKYEHFRYMSEFWDIEFREFLKHVTCRKVGLASARSFFGNKEQYERNCEYLNIPFAYQGMRIEVAEKMGTIVGSNSCCNLDVVFGGRWHAENCHPWWETRYFAEAGNVIKDYREQQVDKDRMEKEQARQNVASFVATREYTYTVNQVVDNYLKYYKNGSYISHSMKDCVQHLVTELEVLFQ